MISKLIEETLIKDDSGKTAATDTLESNREYVLLVSKICPDRRLSKTAPRIVVFRPIVLGGCAISRANELVRFNVALENRVTI